MHWAQREAVEHIASTQLALWLQASVFACEAHTYKLHASIYKHANLQAGAYMKRLPYLAIVAASPKRADL